MDFAIDLNRTDKDLVSALYRQERWAQKLLYEEHYSKMMGICLRYAATRNEALDLLHEGFIKAFQRIDQYKAGTSLPSWIRTIMVNTCIDYYRRNARRRTVDIEEARSYSSADPDVVSNLTEAEILAAVQQLSHSYRTVFNLFVIEGYSHREIADALDITEGTSRSNLAKARLKLQEYLEAYRLEYGIK